MDRREYYPVPMHYPAHQRGPKAILAPSWTGIVLTAALVAFVPFAIAALASYPVSAAGIAAGMVLQYLVQKSSGFARSLSAGGVPRGASVEAVRR